MKINSRAKERIARTFGEYFATNDIATVFKNFGVSVDVSLYAKWRITLDAFSRLSDPENNIPAVIEEFCHPLNFEGEKIQRQTFIDTLNDILTYDDLKLEATEKNVKMVSVTASQSDHFVSSSTEKGSKTSTDYILEAVNFFKNEYNKVRIKGLTYDFSLGENISSEQTDQDPDEYSNKLNAIKRLHEAGLITEYHIEDRVENGGYYVWDYAICKLNEAKLTGEAEQAPPVSAEAVSDFKERVIRHEHNHKHIFENSIQEKDLVLNVHDVHKEQKSQTPKFPYKIQSGTTWDKFYIQFRNPEAVTIRVSGHTHDTSYADMGFADGRTGKPNTQWGLLLLLAKNGGSLTTGDPKANDKYKKHKQLLSDTLKGYFSMDADPFKPYEKDDGYEIKMTLAYSDEADGVTDKTLTSEVDDIFQDLTQ